MGLESKIFILFHSLMVFSNNKNSVRALGNYRDNMSFSALSRALKSEDHEVRILALESLSRIGLKAAYPLFITSLKDPYRTVGIAASNILIRTGKDTVPVLMEELKHVEYEHRAMIIEVLGKIGDNASIPAIVPHIKEEEPVVRNASALALARIGDKGAISLILREIREGKVYFSITPEGLRDDMKSMDLYKKLFAAFLLSLSQDQEAKRMLKKMAENNYGWTRCFIVRMFDDMGKPEDFPLLANMTKDDDVWVRRAAVEVLGNIGDDSVLSILINAANDKDNWVRTSAQASLDKIKARKKQV
jgi:HEAT repeat protein